MVDDHSLLLQPQPCQPSLVQAHLRDGGVPDKLLWGTARDLSGHVQVASVVAAWEGEGRGRERVEGGEGRGGEWSMSSTLVIRSFT